MAETRRHAEARLPWWVGVAVAAAGVAAIATVSVAAITLAVARVVVTPPKRRAEDIRIVGVDSDARTITLESSVDARVPGDYSFWFDGGQGYARVGEITSQTEQTVTRRVLGVDFGDLESARRGRFSGSFYRSPDELGFPYEEVEIETDLGAAPAWLIPAAAPSTRWVIQVHGRAVTRQEPLRAVPVFRHEGFTSLLISYRNDGEAPSSSDGLYALGDTEWPDVEAAIGFALDHGATDVLLMGWSMGGATVLQAITRSPLAGYVRGIILESPVVDWYAALRFQGELRGLPTAIRLGALSMIGGAWARRLTGQATAIDLNRLDFVRRSAELELPTLLMHSTDDAFVPIGASELLAQARPDIITFERFSGASHARLWNYDRDRWNTAIEIWLAGLLLD